MRKFAVFDIDGTLIRWQLYHAIVNELAKQNQIAANAYETIRASRMQWKQRSHDESFKDYERTIIRAYHDSMQDLSVDDYMQAVDKVFDEYKDQVYTYTRDLIKQLRDQDYLLFTVSGSQQEIISKLAEYYGFDEAIGNQYEQIDGKFTGQRQDIISQKGKILDQLIKKHGAGFEGSIAIGDSESDSQMLELVEQPIAFNPSKGLFEIAQINQWKIVVERKNVIYEFNQTSDHYTLNQPDF